MSGFFRDRASIPTMRPPDGTLARKLQSADIVSVRFAFAAATRTLARVRSFHASRFPLIPGVEASRMRPAAVTETFAPLDRFLPSAFLAGTSGRDRCRWVRSVDRTGGAGGNGHRAQACVRETHGGAGRPFGWRLLRPMAITAGSSSVLRASSGQQSNPFPRDAAHVFEADGSPPVDGPFARRPASRGVPLRARESVGPSSRRSSLPTINCGFLRCGGTRLLATGRSPARIFGPGDIAAGVVRRPLSDRVAGVRLPP